MKYTIELKLAGLAKDVTDRPELFFIQGNDEIDRLCDFVGWDQLDEDKPTAMWIQVIDGDYGDIFCTFSSFPYSIHNTVYKVIRKMESVLGPDYDQPVVGTLMGGLKDISNQVDEARDELHALCQISDSFVLANLYRELTAVADKIYLVAYTKERD